MSLFERYLTLWVALCIVAGVVLGHFLPGVFHVIGGAEIAKVNLPVAVLIWLMIIPMLVKIDFAALGRVREHWRGIGVTLFINWAVKPFSMAALGWFFIGYVFRGYLPDRPDRQLHRRSHPARGRALHGDGVRLEQSVGRRAPFHAEPGGAQRYDHGVRLRSDRGAPAGPVGDHGALANPPDFGRALHRRPGCPGADHPTLAFGGRRAGSDSRSSLADCSRSRSRRSSLLWCCCSASRASKSSRSRW